MGKMRFLTVTIPAVAIVAEDECLFSDNRVESAFAGTAVQLTTAIAMVTANRVRGGEASIELRGTKLASVLGNITTGAIVGFTPPAPTPGQPTASWNHLNLRA